MRRVTAGLVLALVAAACGGDGDDGPGPDGAATTTSTATAASTTATTVAAPGTTSVGGRSSTSTAAAPATTTTTVAPPDPGAVFTTPGTYRYATTGQFTSTLTGRQPRDGEAVLTVDPPSGSEQRSVRRSFTRTTEQVVRVDAAGAHLVYLRFGDQGVDKEVRASPPVLALPADAAPGRMWTWRLTSTDGLTSVDSNFRAVRNESVTVAGQSVPTLVVEAVLSFSGDIVSTSTQTLWVSVAHRLVVRQDEATDGRFGAISFSGTSSETLRSLTPG